MSDTPALLDLGRGRAELRLPPGPPPAPAAVRELLVAAFAEPGLRTVVWYGEVGGWDARRLVHGLGFTHAGVVRGWLGSGDGVDAWLATLLRDDPMEPRHAWPDVPVLEADGLRLRPWRADDAARVVEACADATTQAWLGQLLSPYTEESARAWLHDTQERLAAGTAMNWAVVDPADDLVLASVGWFDHTPGVDCEVGYWTHPAARGRRVATRATAAVVRYAFDVLGVRRVRAFAAVGNAASRRVIEANGFTLYGVERLGAWVRDDHVDLALYDVAVGELRR